MILELFLTFLQIGLFSIGGGYVSLIYIQNMIVEQRMWLTMTNYTDLITLSQMTPGPIAINAASFVGMKMSGILGGIVATAGVVMPSYFIVLSLSAIYYRYRNVDFTKTLMSCVRPVIVALMTTVAIKLITMSVGTPVNVFRGVALFSTLFIIRKYKVNPVVMILLTGVVNVVGHLLFSL